MEERGQLWLEGREETAGKAEEKDERKEEQVGRKAGEEARRGNKEVTDGQVTDGNNRMENK